MTLAPLSAVAQALLPAASPLMGTLLVRHRVNATRVETSLDTAGTSACATSADGPALITTLRPRRHPE
jgi:hypothetical protein